MNLWPFRSTPTPINDTEPSRLRFVVATKRENAAARSKRTDIELQLGCYVANTTLKQRRAETEVYYAVARCLSRKEETEEVLGRRGNG